MPPSKHSWSRRLFHRPKKSSVLSPPALVPPDTSHSARSSFQSIGSGSANRASQASNDFLEKVLQLLEPRQRSKIEEYMLGTTDELGMVLDRAGDAALEKRRYCEQQEWKWTYRGREVKLRDVADRLVSFINRFKSVGDSLADIDPVHVGLPWAGIKLILEVTTSETRQMSALLLGVETALYTSRRLQVYFEYLLAIPVSVEKANFEEALLKFYAHILAFLANFIRIFEKKTAARMLKAIINPADCEDFEQKCDQIAQRIEHDANSCDRLLATHDRQLAQSAKRRLARSLAGIQDIRSSIENLSAKIDLSALPTVDAARYEFHVDQRHATCLEGTREDLLQQIDAWARHPQSETIFWLSGMAGTGKSTIATTVASRFAEAHHVANGRLGATFFFKRGEGDRGHARKFFTTLAAQLANKIAALREPIARRIAENPDITRQSLTNQYQKLFLAPLSDISAYDYGHSSLLLIIDALDECDDEDHIRLILRSFQQAQVPVPLRIFVTSRPELPIRLGFASMTRDRYQNLVLHEIPPPMIEHDIAVFLRDEFSRIRSERSATHPRRPYPPDWPGNDKIEDLVKIAVPLFIFAATMCRFIGERRADPAARLAEILHQANGLASKLDQTYLPILNQLLDERGEDREGEIEKFKHLIGPIVTFAEPLSISAMSRLLQIEIDTVASQLDLFHSVLNVPDDDETPVRLLHLSFRDFLTQQGPHLDKHSFSIDQKETHRLIAKKCLALLSEPGILKRDVLSLAEVGIRRKDVEDAAVKKIPAEVAYAASYWVYHLQQSDFLNYETIQVHDFLSTHFLHWLEVMSWLDSAYESMELIDILISLLDGRKECDNLFPLLQDARRFCAQYTYIADLAPLQLYVSALIFTADDRPIKRLFRDSVMVDVSFWSTVPDESSSESKALVGHAGKVNSIGFSSDGAWIISASADWNLIVWNASTRQRVVTFRGHDGPVVYAVFSPDAQYAASASRDKTVRLWSRHTKREVHVFHDIASVVRLSFDRDGKLLYSYMKDTGAITVRDTISGQVVRQFNTISWASATAFSPDGTMFLATDVSYHWRPAEFDSTGVVIAREPDEEPMPSDEYGEHGYYTTGFIKVWRTETGEPVASSNPSRDAILSAEFSGDNRSLITRTDDHKVQLLLTETCEEIMTFDAPKYVNAISISADARIVSVSGANIISVFEIATGKAIMNFRIDYDEGDVMAFSPDSTYLIWAGSVDGKVKVSREIVISSPQTVQTDDQENANDEAAMNRASEFAFAPDGRSLGVIFKDQTIRMFNSRTGDESQRINIGSKEKWSTFDFSSDSKLLLVATKTELQVRSSISGELLYSHPFLEQEPTNDSWLRATFSQNGQLIAFVSSQRKIHILEVLAEKVIQTVELSGVFPEHTPYYAISLQMSPDSRRIAMSSSGFAGVAVVWDLETGDQITSTRMRQRGRILGLEPREHGLFVAWEESNGVYYKNLCSEEEAKRFETDVDIDLNGIVLSPNGNLMVAAASDRRRLQLRETSAGTLLYELLLDYDRDESGSDWRFWGIPRFLKGGTRVQTDLGYLDLPSPLTQQGTSRNLHWWTGHMGNWISKNGRPIIWLPPEYRCFQGASYGHAFVWCSKSSDYVTFLNIEAC